MNRFVFFFVIIFVTVRSELPGYFCKKEDDDPTVRSYREPCGDMYGIYGSGDLFIGIEEIESDSNCDKAYILMYTGEYILRDRIDHCNPFTPELMTMMLGLIRGREYYELSEYEIAPCANPDGREDIPESRVLKDYIHRAVRKGNLDSILGTMFFLTHASITSDWLRILEACEPDEEPSFCKRGYLPIHGRENYRQAGIDLGYGRDWVINPYQVKYPNKAFEASAWAWEHVYDCPTKNRIISDNKLRTEGFTGDLIHEFYDISQKLTGGNNASWRTRKLRLLICFKARFWMGIARGQSICINPFGCGNLTGG